LLLAVTTLVTAWCGYQAARWSGEQSQNYARASTARIRSQEAATPQRPGVVDPAACLGVLQRKLDALDAERGDAPG
jgi:hypothetical protein